MVFFFAMRVRWGEHLMEFSDEWRYAIDTYQFVLLQWNNNVVWVDDSFDSTWLGHDACGTKNSAEKIQGEGDFLWVSNLETRNEQN